MDGPINHDHELYQNGDPIELPKKAGDRLEREKKVVPFKDQKSKDGDKGKGQESNLESESQTGDVKGAGQKENKENKEKKGGKK